MANQSQSIIVDITQSSLAQLGEKLYLDQSLSNPPGQSCASCHLSTSGFADADAHFPVSEGAVAGRFGNRNTPTASYAAFIPEFTGIRNGFLGGQFLDGRADTLEQQALQPFINPLEMNMADGAAVVDQVRLADYASDFRSVFGEDAFSDSDTAFEQIAQAIAEFERTSEFSPFSSKFDAVQANTEVYSVSEQRGQNLFNGRARCQTCHNTDGTSQLFTDFQYKNIGIPANPNNPFLSLDLSLNPDGQNFVDLGLGAVINDADQNGKFRTPTLRNVSETGPYMHNGVFDTLEEVVNFYNRRDVDSIVAEVPQNVEGGRDLGSLNLSAQGVLDLTAFLQTLSDR